MGTVPRLIAIGFAAGVFSALFGVGGGVVIVPLLIVATRFRPHAAAATSTGAILLTAVAGAALYAARGEVRPGYALLVGIPAVVGAVVGSRIQPRLSGQTLSLGFAALLTALAAWMLLG